jgi:hypothetical protein
MLHVYRVYRHPVQAVPQRYTAAVHAAAVQQALQLYASAASGPAVPDLRAQLQSCCQQVWEAGRQQCSQLSLTGEGFVCGCEGGGVTGGWCCGIG